MTTFSHCKKRPRTRRIRRVQRRLLRSDQHPHWEWPRWVRLLDSPLMEIKWNPVLIELAAVGDGSGGRFSILCKQGTLMAYWVFVLLVSAVWWLIPLLVAYTDVRSGYKLEWGDNACAAFAGCTSTFLMKYVERFLQSWNCTKVRQSLASASNLLVCSVRFLYQRCHIIVGLQTPLVQVHVLDCSTPTTATKHNTPEAQWEDLIRGEDLNRTTILYVFWCSLLTHPKSKFRMWPSLLAKIVV